MPVQYYWTLMIYLGMRYNFNRITFYRQKPKSLNRVGRNKKCLAMKTLTIEQMEEIQGGTMKKTLSCISQVAGGMGVLTTVAAIGAFALGPIGWFAFGLSAISLAASAIADPYACD
jgi:hypothetical protein